MDFGYSRKGFTASASLSIFTFPFVVVVVAAVGSVAVPAAVEPRFSLVFSSFFSPFYVFFFTSCLGTLVTAMF